MFYEMKKTELRGVIHTAEFVGNTFLLHDLTTTNWSS